jgi:hypothetical protein
MGAENRAIEAGSYLMSNANMLWVPGPEAPMLEGAAKDIYSAALIFRKTSA